MRTSRNVGSKSCPSGPEGLLRKSTWQVADARRPLVSASHIIQAGNDLFIGKDEAYIMNMRKMEKSMLRKEGNVCALDLFVRVPLGVKALVTYTPMEGCCNQSSCRRKRAREASHVRLQQLNFLRAGGVSVEQRSTRPGAVRPQLDECCGKTRVRPQLDECCGKTRECDSAEYDK